MKLSTQSKQAKLGLESAGQWVTPQMKTRDSGQGMWEEEQTHSSVWSVEHR